MIADDRIHVRRFTFPDRRRDDRTWQSVRVSCVPTTIERIVPRDDEKYAFTVVHYKRTIEVYVSPTGRSVRVFVDGNEVKP